MKNLFSLKRILNLFNFEGRARRRDILVIPLLSIIFWIIVEILLDILGNGAVMPVFLIYILLLYVNVATIVRRLHDMGKNGWWLLLVLIPYLGVIVLIIVLLLSPGDDGENKYGKNPRDKKIKKEKLTPPPIEDIKNEEQ